MKNKEREISKVKRVASEEIPLIDYHIREFDGRLEIPRNEYDKILKRHGHSGTMDDRPILAENHLKLDVNGKKYVRVSGHVDSEEIVPSNMVAGS